MNCFDLHFPNDNGHFFKCFLAVRDSSVENSCLTLHSFFFLIWLFGQEREWKSVAGRLRGYISMTGLRPGIREAPGNLWE